MRFGFQEDDTLFLQEVEKFCQKEMLPSISSEQEEEIPTLPFFSSLQELGFFSLSDQEKWDGMFTSKEVRSQCLMQLARVSPSLAWLLHSHQFCCIEILQKYGSEQQKDKWLPLLFQGEWIGVWSNSYSSKSEKKHVELQEDRLKGTLSNHWFPKHNSLLFLLCFNSETQENELVLFPIPFVNSCFKKHPQSFLGLRGVQWGRYDFSDLSVQEENHMGVILDEEIQKREALSKRTILSLFAGIVRQSLEHSVQYSAERKQFGKPIASFQAIQWKLADMAMVASSLELLSLQAIQEDTLLIDPLFAFCSEKAVWTTQESIQIYGGYGFTREFPVERAYRDVMTLTSLFL